MFRLDCPLQGWTLASCSDGEKGKRIEAHWTVGRFFWGICSCLCGVWGGRRSSQELGSAVRQWRASFTPVILCLGLTDSTTPGSGCTVECSRLPSSVTAPSPVRPYNGSCCLSVTSCGPDTVLNTSHASPHQIPLASGHQVHLPERSCPAPSLL